MGGWQPGDLALCVNLRPRRRVVYPGLSRLRVGHAYHVSAVTVDWDGEAALIFRNVKSDSPNGAFWHGRFIKITPEQADQFDREVIAAMRGEPVTPELHPAVTPTPSDVGTALMAPTACRPGSVGQLAGAAFFCGDKGGAGV